MQDKQREGQGTHCMVVALAKRLFLEPSLISQRNFLWCRRCSGAAFLAHLPFSFSCCQTGWIGCPIWQRRAEGEGWQGKEEGRSRPFKSRGAEPCDLQGSAQWYFLPKKSLNGNIGKIENYIISKH